MGTISSIFMENNFGYSVQYPMQWTYHGQNGVASHHKPIINLKKLTLLVELYMKLGFMSSNPLNPILPGTFTKTPSVSTLSSISAKAFFLSGVFLRRFLTPEW